jgi:hypothetical protein
MDWDMGNESITGGMAPMHNKSVERGSDEAVTETRV